MKRRIRRVVDVVVGRIGRCPIVIPGGRPTLAGGDPRRAGGGDDGHRVALDIERVRQDINLQRLPLISLDGEAARRRGVVSGVNRDGHGGRGAANQREGDLTVPISEGVRPIEIGGRRVCERAVQADAHTSVRRVADPMGIKGIALDIAVVGHQSERQHRVI